MKGHHVLSESPSRLLVLCLFFSKKERNSFVEVGRRLQHVRPPTGLQDFVDQPLEQPGPSDAPSENLGVAVVEHISVDREIIVRQGFDARSNGYRHIAHLSILRSDAKNNACKDRPLPSEIPASMFSFSMSLRVPSRTHSLAIAPNSGLRSTSGKALVEIKTALCYRVCTVSSPLYSSIVTMPLHPLFRSLKLPMPKIFAIGLFSHVFWA